MNILGFIQKIKYIMNLNQKYGMMLKYDYSYDNTQVKSKFLDSDSI